MGDDRMEQLASLLEMKRDAELAALRNLSARVDTLKAEIARSENARRQMMHIALEDTGELVDLAAQSRVAELQSEQLTRMVHRLAKQLSLLESERADQRGKATDSFSRAEVGRGLASRSLRQARLKCPGA